MIYNDGVQTVIKMASIYGKDELHLSTATLLGTLLMVHHRHWRRPSHVKNGTMVWGQKNDNGWSGGLVWFDTFCL